MEKEKNNLYRVLVSHTTPLFNMIKKLGFKEEKSKGHGLKEIRKFKKDGKYIHSTHYYVELFTIDLKTQKRIVIHKSLTIHDEILKFFANRNPIEIKNEWDKNI